MDQDRESQIIGRAAAGDPQAFLELVEAHKDALFSLTAMMTGRPAEAADLLQETFVRAFRGLRGFDRKRPFFPWLYSICLNVNRSHLKKRARLPEAPYLPHDWEDLASPEADPEEALLERQEVEGLRRGLLQIPLPDREILLLRFYQGLSFEAVAAALGTSEEAAKKRLYRALEKLRLILNPPPRGERPR